MFKPTVQHMRFKETEFSFFVTNEVALSWYGTLDQSHHAETAWCMSKIKPGMTVVDCGAHHGYFAVLFGKATGPQGKVFTYELFPENAWTVDMNVRLNRLRNVTVRSVGLSDHAAETRIVIDGGNSRVEADAPINANSTIVNVVRLDDDLPAGTKVDFLKVDVEGHDLQALRGMQAVLAHRPILNLELHNFLFKDRIETLSAIKKMLDPLNYSWEIQGTNAEAPQPLPRIDLVAIAALDNPHLLGTPR